MYLKCSYLFRHFRLLQCTSFNNLKQEPCLSMNSRAIYTTPKAELDILGECIKMETFVQTHFSLTLIESRGVFKQYLFFCLIQKQNDAGGGWHCRLWAAAVQRGKTKAPVYLWPPVGAVTQMPKRLCTPEILNSGIFTFVLFLLPLGTQVL